MAKNILITGGAGFIGCNAAQRYASRGDRVTLVDQLSRTGSERNLAWIKSLNFPNVTFVKADIRDAKSVSEIFEKEASGQKEPATTSTERVKAIAEYLSAIQR